MSNVGRLVYRALGEFLPLRVGFNMLSYESKRRVLALSSTLKNFCHLRVGFNILCEGIRTVVKGEIENRC